MFQLSMSHVYFRSLQPQISSDRVLMGSHVNYADLMLRLAWEYPEIRAKIIP